MAKIEWYFEIEDEYGSVWELRKATGGLNRITGLRLPPADLIAQATPTQHGSDIVGFRVTNREVVCAVDVPGAYVGPHSNQSPSMLRRDRSIGDVLGYLSGNLILRARYRTLVRELRRCKYAGGIEGDSDSFGEDNELLAFLLISGDPMFYDPNSTTLGPFVYADFDHGVYASTLTIDGTDNLTIGGNWFTYPTLVIEGACTDFDLESVTTGQRLRYYGEIVVGDSVTIETNPKILTAVNGGGVDVRSSIPPGDDFGGFALWPPKLTSGTGNNSWTLTVQGIDANFAFYITWENRHQYI